MFTAKFYSADGFRQVIKEAESFTVLRSEDGCAEITLHHKNPADDHKIDIAEDGRPARGAGWPPCFAKAIIENAAGRTTEIVALAGPLLRAERTNTDRGNDYTAACN